MGLLTLDDFTNKVSHCSSNRWLILILAVVAVTRVFALILFAPTMSLKTSGYDVYATHMMEGQGYTRYDDRSADSDLPPLYPFFLVGVYTLFGRSPIPVASIQIGFDLCTTLLVYLIGKHIAGEKVGLLSATLYGLYPYLIYQSLTLNDTCIFILLLVTSIWLAYRVCNTSNWRYAAALGGALGLAALTKTLVVALLPLLGLWWYRHLGLRRSVQLSVIGSAVLLAVISPWIVRNILVQKDFVLISTNGGSNFHQGNNACVVEYLRRGWDAQWVECLDKPPNGLSEIEESRWHTQQAFDYLQHNFDKWPRLFGTKLLVLWSPVLRPTGVPPDIPPEEALATGYHSPIFQPARVVHSLYFGSLLVLALPGIVLALHSKLQIGPLVSVFIVITVAYVIFHPSTRYRSPADPFVFILSAYALVQLWGWIKAHLQRDRLLL